MGDRWSFPSRPSIGTYKWSRSSVKDRYSSGVSRGRWLISDRAGPPVARWRGIVGWVIPLKGPSVVNPGYVDGDCCTGSHICSTLVSPQRTWDFLFSLCHFVAHCTMCITLSQWFCDLFWMHTHNVIWISWVSCVSHLLGSWTRQLGTTPSISWRGVPLPPCVSHYT